MFSAPTETLSHTRVKIAKIEFPYIALEASISNEIITAPHTNKNGR